ncbi:lysophosphatidic acid receptor 1-A-like [Galendromus occidentalis]|uniref:Lysophosphatidic acid receptor 1-A-like n=1 Tax=Galendromus occidentalis TaxID=34638 RepID=A0AAJ6QN65_9ACAR|nr:lysophosphatidic acid receptor 1-A-like [Galendromus occidentalis]
MATTTHHSLLPDDGTVAVGVATAGAEVADEEQQMRKVYDFAVPLLVLACVISTLFNLIVLVSLRWLRRSINPTLSLSLSLTFADAYASFMLGLGFVINSYLPLLNVEIHRCFNLVLEALRLSGLVAAAFNLLALSFNHYVGILRPLHYASTVTRRSAYIGIVLLWAFPLVIFFTYFSSVPDQGFRSDECSNFAFLRESRFSVLLGMLFTVPLVVMMFIYFHIFFIIRQHKIGLFAQTSSRHASRRLQNVKAVYTTLLIIGTYLAGWMPAVCFYVFTCTDSCPFPVNKLSMTTRISGGILVNALIIAKSLVDPFIYAARMPEVSEALSRMFRCRPRPTFRHARAASYNRNFNNNSTPCFPKSPIGTPLRGDSQRTDCTYAGSRAVYVSRPRGGLVPSHSVGSLANSSPPIPTAPPPQQLPSSNGLNHNGAIRSPHHHWPEHGSERLQQQDQRLVNDLNFHNVHLVPQQQQQHPHFQKFLVSSQDATGGGPTHHLIMKPDGVLEPTPRIAASPRLVVKTNL